MIHDIKHAGIEIKFYNLDTFKKQIDVNFIDLDSELVDLNYKVASLIFCHFWRSIELYDQDSFGLLGRNNKFSKYAKSLKNLDGILFHCDS